MEGIEVVSSEWKSHILKRVHVFVQCRPSVRVSIVWCPIPYCGWIFFFASLCERRILYDRRAHSKPNEISYYMNFIVWCMLPLFQFRIALRCGFLNARFLTNALWLLALYPTLPCSPRRRNRMAIIVFLAVKWRLCAIQTNWNKYFSLFNTNAGDEMALCIRFWDAAFKPAHSDSLAITLENYFGQHEAVTARMH